MRRLKFPLLAVTGFILGYNLSPLVPGSGVEQPFSFNHQIHRPMDCTFCHPGAQAGIKAGLPKVEICLRCHATSPLNKSQYREVWSQAERGSPITWNKLTKVPSHVYFSHNRHVKLGGLACQQCHGNISMITSPPHFALKDISMKNCRNCHQNANVTQDCAACHR